MKKFIDKTTENLEEKIKVTSLEIIVTGTKEKPYFEIKYKELGKEDYDIGYSSYDLNNVFTWKDECFEIVNELAEEYKREHDDTDYANIELYAFWKNHQWIPCSERLPELTEGTEYFKQSKCCLVALKWWDGDITENVGWYNQSGVWNEDSKNCKVLAWMPLPAPYTEGE